MRRTHTPDNSVPNLNGDKQTTTDELIDDSLRSARNSLAMLHGTKEVAADTLQALDAQGEQIKNMQADVDHVLHNEAIAERHLRSIASIWGSFCNWFRPHPVAPNHVRENTDKKSDKKQEKSKRQNSGVKTLFAGDIVDTTKMSSDSANKIRETDDVLDQMGPALDDLLAMAKEMGSELNKQNQDLQVLTETTIDANTGVKKQTRETRRLAGRLK